MYDIEFSRKFKKDLSKLQSDKRFKISELEKVLKILNTNETIPIKYKNHKLHGDMKNISDIHIQNDVIMLYEKDDVIRLIALLRIGTHSELF